MKWQKLIYKIYSDKIKFDPNIIKIELDNLIKNKKEIVQYRISEIEILIDNSQKDKEKNFEHSETYKNQGFET